MGVAGPLWMRLGWCDTMNVGDTPRLTFASGLTHPAREGKGDPEFSVDERS